MLEETVVTYLKELFRNSPRDTEENHDNLQNIQYSKEDSSWIYKSAEWLITGRTTGVRFLSGISFFVTTYSLALGPTQWVPEALFLGDKTTGSWSWPLSLIQRLRICGAVPPHPHTSSWHGAQRITYSTTVRSKCGAVWGNKKCVCFMRMLLSVTYSAAETSLCPSTF